MKLTAQIQLLPTKEQAELLKQTMIEANKVCNFVSQIAWDDKLFSAFKLQKSCYSYVRDMYALSSQVTIQCIRKVADSYKKDKKAFRQFRPLGAITYDARILTYRTKEKRVSIWTVRKRQKIPYILGEHQEKLLQYQQGESDLVFSKGKWYLLATCDIEEKELIQKEDIIGVDMGIINIATTSNNTNYTGEQIEEKREWFLNRRKVLQSVGTKSAKRRLKKLSGKEKRFRRDVNHCISKKIVHEAKIHNCDIAVEDLKGIRKAKVRKKQRARHHSWSFHQLRLFIAYKAKIEGIEVIPVDPRNTSRTCFECGHCEKANRKSRDTFSCKSCGHTEDADYNAAKNIKNVAVNLRTVSALFG